ncbi:NADH-ubiquinone/plastoquinone oxidoreductase subunit 6 [bacterium DOLJORAL78_65_58]|nr:MAG: NADH-ubiquinone/plastoquinone oxidoreductase subunit 6 [bacterium DOLZORAL124_64_63]PIE75977.1 MAG: NADH-ubiquinone/plastoquinone oxidoreductase subunit 6 [bacterium DOLJORAL78_65_58]
MEAFLFWFCGILMFLGGVMTVTQRNAVVSAVWLIFAFVAAAGIFALLSAPFLAIMQILVYAGAIMVLFLFVIMMLQGPVLEDERRGPNKVWLVLACLPAAAILVTIIGWIKGHGGRGLGEAVAEGFGTAEAVSHLLLGRYLLAFELISIVLLVGIIGALALGKGERNLPWR